MTINPFDELEADDDGDFEMPARPRNDIAPADLALLKLAARAIGAEFEEVDGEQWGNLHFADGSIEYHWNSLVHGDNTLDLSVRLELDILHRVVGGKRIETLAPGGPLTQEFYEGDQAAAMVATRRVVTRAAAEIAVARSKKQA